MTLEQKNDKSEPEGTLNPFAERKFQHFSVLALLFILEAVHLQAFMNLIQTATRKLGNDEW